LSYVKKTTGGVKLTPPSGNRVNLDYPISEKKYITEYSEKIGFKNNKKSTPKHILILINPNIFLLLSFSSLIESALNSII